MIGWFFLGVYTSIGIYIGKRFAQFLFGIATEGLDPRPMDYAFAGSLGVISIGIWPIIILGSYFVAGIKDKEQSK